MFAKTTLTGIAVLALGTPVHHASAQNFPVKPIRFIVPLAAGGPGDVLARALGTTGAGRTSAAPELPPISEAGLPGYEVSVWYGILAPAGTPTAVINRLHPEISKIVQLPEIKERWAVLGAEPLHNTPEQFAAFLKADLGKWAKVVRDSGAKID